MRLDDALSILSALGVKVDNVRSILSKAGLDVGKFNAATPDDRRKILKTALRTFLPFPLSLAAGEVLAQLARRSKAVRDAIAKGVKL